VFSIFVWNFVSCFSCCCWKDSTIYCVWRERGRIIVWSYTSITISSNISISLVIIFMKFLFLQSS
jgi:hypothetical protein